MGLEPGELSRHLGYVPVGVDPASLPPDVLTSIANDPNLSRDARRRLLAVYRAELDTGAASA